MKILVTGSGGLIGSEVCAYFDSLNCQILGIDNNYRKLFFGNHGSVSWKIDYLKNKLLNYEHFNVDITDKKQINLIFKKFKPNAIIHCAAQPSHDLAKKIIYKDFEVNTLGTLNLLESCANHTPNAPFVFMSTNKVYGDNPNNIPMKELSKRWDYKNEYFKKGIDENFSIDHSTHSFFGCSKLSADIYVQEFGKNHNLKTCSLRGGCLTGPSHSGVELHGFLSYIIKANLKNIPYTIFGYKGKQVRDNIHSRDVSKFIEMFINNPKKGEVYNIGGGYENSCSILEIMKAIEVKSNLKFKKRTNSKNRIGDHICYYSNLTKIKKHYPKWKIEITLSEIIDQIIFEWRSR